MARILWVYRINNFQKINRFTKKQEANFERDLF